MKAWILLTGDELIEGRVADTNGAYLARALTDLGVAVLGLRFVGDDIDPLVSAMREGLADADALIVSGGLGGTADDLTREAVAAAFDRPLEHSPAARQNVFEFYERVGRKLPPEPWPESMAPRGTIVHANRAGLAPGLEVPVGPDGRKRVFAFPGVPAELEYLVGAGMLNRLAPPGIGLARADVGIAGWRESDAARALGELMTRGRNPVVGIGAKDGTLVLHMRARAADRAGAEGLLARDLGIVRGIFGPAIFTTTGETPAEATARRFFRLEKTLAVAESLTGGWIGHLLTEVPGMSSVLRTDIVAYTPEMKTALLGVPADLIQAQGVVSGPVALAMADGVLRQSGADFAIATTGVAGPGGGSAETPVGTAFVAVKDREGRSLVESRRHIGSRTSVKKRTAAHAFDLLRRFLISIGLDTGDAGS